MKILGIETSCDETALAIVEASGGQSQPASPVRQQGEPQFKVLAETLNSQTKIHEKYGGVFPMMAKREHGKNLIPLLKKLVDKLNSSELKVQNEKFNVKEIEKILEREPELLRQFLEAIPAIPKPDINAIAVTVGPGLEPALWVGINFAKALGLIWNIPVLPTNHMEGHIVSVLIENQAELKFPAIALLISGGHTELILMNKWHEYQVLGQTRDDAVGEAFDKVGRMMELPYPGGPEISRLAGEARSRKLSGSFQLPRPMINSNDYDFSFSGLKTSVLYTIRKMSEEEKSSPTWKEELAREFEDAVADVLVTKTRRALKEFDAKTLIVGGGVVANQHLRFSFQNLIKAFPDTELLIPKYSLSTDNAVMIAIAGYFNSESRTELTTLQAQGNLALK